MPITGGALLAAIAFAGLWYTGHKTVQGIKSLDHKIVNKLHHKKASIPVDATVSKE